MIIDVKYKMYADCRNGLDPDTFSKKLHQHHKYLWMKKLPNNILFNITSSNSAPYYFKYINKKIQFDLSSDSIIHTYSKWKSMGKIIDVFTKRKIKRFFDFSNTIGAYIIFPSNKINNKPTINGIRGMHPKINDRFDLTLECIRLWYLGISNPLYNHIDRYNEFFKIFTDFKNYVDFFLLNDLVDKKYEKIKFWLPFIDFENSKSLPHDKKSYSKYMKNVIGFVKLRNERIKRYTRIENSKKNKEV